MPTRNGVPVDPNPSSWPRTQGPTRPPYEEKLHRSRNPAPHTLVRARPIGLHIGEVMDPSLEGGEITRAYALAVGDRTHCVFLTWDLMTTTENALA